MEVDIRRKLSIQASSEANCRPRVGLRTNYHPHIDLSRDNRWRVPLEVPIVCSIRWSKWLIPLLVLFCQTLPGLAMKKELFYRVTEELQVGSSVADVKEDAGLLLKYDLDTVKQFHYQFLTEPPTNFAIGNISGIISTSGRIDRDELCPNKIECSVQLDVAIRPVHFFQIIKVTVEILDLNDNAPVFDKPRINHFMFESASVGTGFTVPTATDPDSPEYTVIAYELMTEASNFELKVTQKPNGAKEVRLVLIDRLDRETQSMYEMQIVAFDGGIPSKSGSVELRISVGDANDNSPVFERSVYEVSVKENIAVHTLLLTVSATDPDEDINGMVEYEFSEQTQRDYGQLFAIGRQSGAVTVEGIIDYEMESIYNLVVVGRDLGSDSTPGDTTIIVRVEDVNDHAPLITVNTLLATGSTEALLPENSPVNTFVAHLTVRDPDKGIYGKFNCSLKDSFFRLERLYDSEYSIFTAGSLDREKQTGYNLALVCKDKGTPPLVAVQHINVTITDVNDNSPVFLQNSYSAELLENNYIGAILVQVNASDADSGKNAHLEYIIEGEEAMYFSVDSRSGVVTARAALDREERDLYTFFITARDGGQPPRSASALLSIRVMDVNDERPRFSNLHSYSFGVTEGRDAGEEVGTVWADDADGTPYNAFTFSLVASESQTDAFFIDPTGGRISTTRRLDREQQDIYRLLVVATDVTTPSMSSTSSVTVYVMDVNDNTPTFTFPVKHNNTVFISNKVPRQHTIVNVTASDPDIGNNSRLFFEISRGNNENYFLINEKTGAVYLERDASSIRNRTFKLLVAVMDHGSPQLVSASELNIIVDSSIVYAEFSNESALFGGFNFSTLFIVLIALAVTVVIVGFVLTLGILIRNHRLRHDRSHKYNCRTEALKSLTAKEALVGKNAQNGSIGANSQKSKEDLSEFSGKSVSSVKDGNGALLNKNGGRHVLEADSGMRHGDTNDLSHEKSVQWLATLGPPDYEQLPNTSKKESRTGNHYSRANEAPSHMASRELPKVPQPTTEHMSHLKDGDLSSIHSGDGSYADSGRGSIEKADAAHGSRLEAHQAGFLYGKTSAAQNNNSVLLKTRPVHQNFPLNQSYKGKANNRPQLVSFRSNVPSEQCSRPAVCTDSLDQIQCVEDGRLANQGSQSLQRSNGYTPLAQSSPGDYHGGTRHAHALSSSGYSTNSSNYNNDVTPTNDCNEDGILSEDDATIIG